MSRHRGDRGGSGSAACLRRRRLAPAVCAALVLIAGAGRADVLVTTDGTSLVTRGAWSVDGRVVRFHDQVGALRTLRLVDVDLDASRAASAEDAGMPAAAVDSKGATPAVAESPTGSPIAAAAASAKTMRATSTVAVLVLRDGDVAAADPAAVSAAGAAASRPAPFVLYVTTWCTWCKKERQLLASLGVTWIEKDTERTPGAQEELLRLTGAATVPVLAHGSRVVRGFRVDAIRQLVAESRAAERPRALERSP